VNVYDFVAARASKNSTAQQVPIPGVNRLGRSKLGEPMSVPDQVLVGRLAWAQKVERNAFFVGPIERAG
jgi:hypothetical protein